MSSVVQRATDDQLPRRSACDRCRAHKLRCLRDEGTIDVLNPCQRCSKARVACSTGISGRSGRPSKSVKEKYTKTSAANILGNVEHSHSATSSSQPGPTPLSIPLQSHNEAFETSPAWLLDWDNMLQPSSGGSNEPPQDHTFIAGATDQDAGLLVTGAMNFERSLDLGHSNSLGISQNDVMNLEGQGFGPAHESSSEMVPDVYGNQFTPPHVEQTAEIPDTYLEIIDLKEEVLRRLADLHSGLLADLNLMRDVGKCPCKHTSRVALASSQRNADGKTEEYNFLIGRMLNKAEIFVSILQHFTAPSPTQSSSGIGASESESGRSDEDQELMNAFTSWNTGATPHALDLTSFESSASSAHLPGARLRCDVPMTLSILTCYVCLVRIYRTLFSSIHAALLIARERNMELPPLFPGLKLGGFAPQMNFQVQILVQISTRLLNQIDEALGLPDQDSQTKKRVGILDQTGSAGLLQTMIKEEAFEGLENGDPSKESPKEIFRKLSLLC